jgi:AbrB family looped-hinge helix DNA binding protein
MSISTLTSKGQTTIPLEIRDFLSLNAGDRLEFIKQEDGRVLLVPATVDVSALKGILPKPKKAVSLRDMQKAIAARKRL